jgi:aminodeoxyfutalosine deaminase
METESFIRRLPKAELHLHLEGTITPATLVDLSARHDAQAHHSRRGRGALPLHDFTGFIEAFKAVTRHLIGPRTTNSPPGA